MGQRTTFGDSPTDEISRPDLCSGRPAQSDNSAAAALELLRTLARDGGRDAPNTLELLRTLAQRGGTDAGTAGAMELLRTLAQRGGGADATEDALELLRSLAHGCDKSERAPRMLDASPDAVPSWSRRLAALAAAAKTNAGSARSPRLPAGAERGREAALIAAVGAAAFIAAAVAGALLLSRGSEHAAPRVEVSAPAAAPANPAAAPAADAPAVAQAVQTAMAECDREAERNPDTLHFLVTPVMPAGDAFRLSAEAREEYDSFSLVTAKAMLEGLQDGSLALNARPFRFVIIDSATGQTQIWSAATGMSKFTHKDAAAFSKFRVGFDIPDKGPQWSNEYPRRAGVCYWVNVRFHWG
jgi:hypothetical protein